MKTTTIQLALVAALQLLVSVVAVNREVKDASIRKHDAATSVAQEKESELLHYSRAHKDVVKASARDEISDVSRENFYVSAWGSGSAHYATNASMSSFLQTQAVSEYQSLREEDCEAVKSLQPTLLYELNEGRTNCALAIEWNLPSYSKEFMKCCGMGTDYDYFLAKEVRDRWDGQVDANTVLFVIDMQNDFTTGSFAEPCWMMSNNGKALREKIAELIGQVSDADGTIIASKDFHPADHCSFFDNDLICANEDTTSKRTHGDGKRYINRFPPHCTYAVKEEGISASDGSKFDWTINQALNTANKKSSGKVHVVFKGFNKAFDSFGAVRSPLPADQHFTGGWAINNQEERCKDNLDECVPTAQEIGAPEKNMLSAHELFGRTLDPNSKILVVGLVFDFCVKETAMFAKKFIEDSALPSHVTVLADLTRPALDGLPGLSVVSGSEGRCATVEAMQKVKAELITLGVQVATKTCR